ncbi:hypothetical protein QVD17_42233 [Tagetes erecta]|uniref:Uncharacterized protein n=1 Tax=Tagetes erecta TaxID=13708 RepID=A0AAD8NFE0_TARER|nr:hypothetical protein QVD17_42233 [Tagetes erecta]
MYHFFLDILYCIFSVRQFVVILVRDDVIILAFNFIMNSDKLQFDNNEAIAQNNFCYPIPYMCWAEKNIIKQGDMFFKYIPGMKF